VNFNSEFTQAKEKTSLSLELGISLDTTQRSRNSYYLYRNPSLSLLTDNLDRPEFLSYQSVSCAMYSNYSYSQAVSGAQAPITTTTTNGVWNGSQWVMPAPPPPVANPATAIIKHGKTHAELVSHYTTYYHYWNAQVDEAKLALARIAPTSSAEREECERREKWASYYASNAAALAHYHLSLSRGGAEPYQRPASPPAPPQLSGAHVGPVSAVGGTAVVNSPVAAAPSTGRVQSVSEGVINISPKSKKSRWTKSPEDTNNGKSEAVTAGSPLYNNFVGETKSIESKAGTKRKMADRKESSVSLPNDSSYYGPSSVLDSSWAKEDDFVPLGLDKPLGATKKETKKEKKAKLAKAASFGFETSSKAMAKRANRFQGKGGIEDVSNVKSTIDNVEKYMGKTVIGGSTKQLDEEDFERMKVKGTCQVLEKEYLRLTAPPRPELVRPQPILEKHLAALKKSWNKGRKHGGKVRDYNWYCSQFKALRQDLTVQRIFNAFAVVRFDSALSSDFFPLLSQSPIWNCDQCRMYMRLTPKLLLKWMTSTSITNLKRSSRNCTIVFRVTRICRKIRVR
jgi:hypothetical protein